MIRTCSDCRESEDITGQEYPRSKCACGFTRWCPYCHTREAVKAWRSPELGSMRISVCAECYARMEASYAQGMARA
jgi:hypothetical protein